MLQLKKTKKKQQKIIVFHYFKTKTTIFFIDKTFKIPIQIDVSSKDNILFLKKTSDQLTLKITNELFVFNTKNKLLFSVFIKKNKKRIINLYTKLLLIKLKGLLQGFKITLVLKGIGFKAFVNKNILKLNLGFSHSLFILIPNYIKLNNKSNHLIFSSSDFINLLQFVHFIKKFKKPEPYKGKGLLLKNEIIVKKEGKKSKK